MGQCDQNCVAPSLLCTLASEAIMHVYGFTNVVNNNNNISLMAADT